MTSGSLCGVMVSTLPGNASDVDSIPSIGVRMSFSMLPHDTGAVTMILYKLRDVWLLYTPCVCIRKVIAWLCVCECGH